MTLTLKSLIRELQFFLFFHSMRMCEMNITVPLMLNKLDTNPDLLLYDLSFFRNSKTGMEESLEIKQSTPVLNGI